MSASNTVDVPLRHTCQDITYFRWSFVCIKHKMAPDKVFKIPKKTISQKRKHFDKFWEIVLVYFNPLHSRLKG